MSTVENNPLSKTISQYIGSNFFLSLAFLIFALFLSVFLLKKLRKVDNGLAKAFFLICIICLLGVAIFPYGEKLSSQIHQIFADGLFLSSLAFAIISLFQKPRPLTIIFACYAFVFIFMYILKFPPFRATELIWESLYFILALAIFLKN